MPSLVKSESTIKRRRLDAVALQVGDGRLDVAREALAEVGAFGVVQARRRHQANVRTEVDGHAERWRELRHGVGDAVVGRVGDDHARAARAHLGDAIGQVVGLAAGAGQHQVGQVSAGHAGEQALGQLEDGVVEVSRVGRKRLHLAADRLGHRGVAVTERGDVVVDVEVAAAFRVHQPHAVTAHDVQRVFVHQPVGRAEQRIAPLDHCLGGGPDVGAAGDVGVDHVEVSGGFHEEVPFRVGVNKRSRASWRERSAICDSASQAAGLWRMM